MKLAWSFALLLVALPACSSAPPKQVDAPEPLSTETPEPVDEPLADAPEPDPEPAPSKPKPDPGADDYEINHRDCEVLAKAYARSWLNDERATLKKKQLKQAQYDKIAAQLEEDSAGMFDNYLSQCGNTVGTSYLRSRLMCAAKAESMKQFDGCMDGSGP